jgi:two-component system CheB/CheR fusion protein
MKSSRSRQTKKQPKAMAQERPTPRPLFPLVGIGASAGGLEAFSELLHHLPEKTGMAFVLVQHLDPKHGSVLQEILARITKIPVTYIVYGVAVQTNYIYVIPANADLEIHNGALQLKARMLTHGTHMPIDRFLRSLAEDRGERAISVILSGTAYDGTEGCRAIKAAGGITFAQDEKTAKYNSMPRSAVNSECVDFVLPPKKIARELASIGQHPHVAYVASPAEVEVAGGDDLEGLFALLRKGMNVDFTHYKHTTLLRRIRRRMVLQKLEKLNDYVRYVKKTPGELVDLFHDLLIHVTGFFRESEAFEALRNVVYPNLFQDRKPDTPIRVWVPGCSTGEEAYSIAITLLEYSWIQSRNLSQAATAIQIFATDISDTSLNHARTGLYSESVVANISPQRLARFFVRVDGGYQISKSIRDMCVFALHTIAKDPPFSNLDFISCRNLLIYLGPVLQKRVISTLHYALKPSGYLMMGASESLGTFADYFGLVDKKYKIYHKKKTATRLAPYFTGMDYALFKDEEGRTAKEPPPGFAIEKDVQRLLLNRFVPASIVVNEEMEIVQFHGRTGAYLEPAPGQPTFSLSKMAREGLLVDLRTALAAAKKENAPVRKEGVRIQSNGGTRNVDFEVIPIHGHTPPERFYVVVFQDASPPTAPSAGKRRGKISKAESPTLRQNERQKRELTQLREQLQSLIEDHETTTEEFKAANEEVISANEELQSTNEELETAKEELQSGNEELTTLNEEMENRNTELTQVNNDLLNLFGNANIPVVMLSNDLRIRRFTPPAQKMLNLLPGDIGRRLGEIRPNLDLQDLEGVARETVKTATLYEREVRATDGKWHLLRIRPYRTLEEKIDGAVISLQDIDILKRTLDQTRDYAAALIETARESILVLDGKLRVTAANLAFYRTFEVSREETEKRQIFELGNGQWDIPRLRQLLEDIIESNTRVDDFEVQNDFPHLGSRSMLLNAHRIETQPGRRLILLAIEDVTENRKYEASLKQQAALLALAPGAIIVRNWNGTIQSWNQGAMEMYGWTKEEAVGKVVHHLLQTEFPQPLVQIEAEMTRTGRWQGELLHTRRDGVRIHVSTRQVMHRENERAAPVVLVTSTDVTERKKSEESLRQLSAYLIRLQDEERRRIARELHDSTGQKLVALKLSVSALAQGGGGEATPPMMECMKLVDETIQEIRTLAQLLHPPLIDEAGLVSATQWLVDSFSARSGISVDLTVSLCVSRLPEHVDLAIFRVIQESLNNIHRHSGAKKAKIEITQADGTVRLQVSDDGKGLPQGLLSEAPTRLGVGILGMKERLSQLGGELEIISGKKGTTVKAVVPEVGYAA